MVPIRTRLSPDKLAALVVVVLVIVAVSGYFAARSSGSLGNGPLGDGGDYTEACTPTSPGQAVTTASVRLPNAGSKPAVLDSFEAVGAKGVKVLGASVVQIGNDGSIGLDVGYPPAYRPQGFGWDQRHPVPGAAIPSQGVGPTRYVLAVGLSRSGSDVGTVSGFKVKYHVGGDDYMLRTHNAVRLATHCN